MIDGGRLQPDRYGCISHVADNGKRYPSEPVNFYTQVKAGDLTVPGSSSRESILSVFVPVGLALEDYLPRTGGNGTPVSSVVVRDTPEGAWIDWCLDSLPEGAVIEVITRTRVRPTEHNLYVTSNAVLRSAQGDISAKESATVAVRAQSVYMRHLPEIYHGDDLMNRLLMLVESFWQPLEEQIAHPEVYYDAGLAPEGFLNWLAGWIGVPMEENIPPERKRRLLSAALSLYQRYGTRSALIEFLRLYTGGEVEIYEHRAENFCLGPQARLGLTMALGQWNFPHTFTIKLSIPRQELLDLFDKEQAANAVMAEKMYRRRIEAIIDAQKPAHTAFTLNLNIIDAAKTSNAVPERKE